MSVYSRKQGFCKDCEHWMTCGNNQETECRSRPEELRLKAKLKALERMLLQIVEARRIADARVIARQAQVVINRISEE
jgi:hypothetical protein